MDLSDWLATQRLVVCVGSGGVGKTTTAASIALRGALDGRKVVVLTIDPAKRLANSLGLDALGNEAHRIDLAEIGDQTGELWAMMLDSHSTWDGLVRRLARDEEVRKRILSNRIYRYVATSFAGSQEYMATERLHDLAQSGIYDLIVLDTPPVKNALDFLESPARLINFFDERILRWFLAPYQRGRFGRRLMYGPTAVVWRLLGSIFGREFLDDLAQFFRDFQGLYDGFVQRHDSVVSMFRGSETSFVTVCAPTESSIEVAGFFDEELLRQELCRAGLLVNQVHSCEGQSHDARAVMGERIADLESEVSPQVLNAVMARLGMAHRRLKALTEEEQRLLTKLRTSTRPSGFYQEIPRLPDQVHDLDGLNKVARAIFDQPAQSLERQEKSQ